MVGSETLVSLEKYEAKASFPKSTALMPLHSILFAICRLNYRDSANFINWWPLFLLVHDKNRSVLLAISFG